MAISENTYVEAERGRRGILDINTETYYFENLRPYVQEMMRTCKTDGELYRTLDKVVNAVDSLCARKQFKKISDELDVLNIAINDRNYFNGPMKRAPESEKEMVRKLRDKLSDFLMIIKCEPDDVAVEEKTKERLDYNSPTGENIAYSIHNMKELNKPITRERIPNI